MMDRHEKYVADGGYRDGGTYGITPSGLRDEQQKRQGKIRARHETINSRLKEWKSLSGVFRHKLRLHFYVFMSIANVTQLELEEETSAFKL